MFWFMNTSTPDLAIRARTAQEKTREAWGVPEDFRGRRLLILVSKDTDATFYDLEDPDKSQMIADLFGRFNALPAGPCPFVNLIYAPAGYCWQAS